MSNLWQPARIYRLCLKELRESLRDRRTIITLVLMPLLVYPLLSMILQRLLLSTATSPQTPTLRIGIEDESLLEPLQEAIALGKQILATQGREVLSIEHPDAPPTILTGEKARSQSAVRHLLSQEISMFRIERDGRQALLSGAVDVLVRGAAAPLVTDSRPAAVEAQQSSEEQPPDEQPPDELRPDQQASDGQASDSQAGLDQIPDSVNEPSEATAEPPRLRGPPLEQIRQVVQLMPEDRYRLQYVAGDPHSEMAVQFLRSVFAAVNDETSRQIIALAGPEYHPRISMAAAPIKLPNNTPATLASLVPLVLVLMTIAGAVYPAIDLTAGERERGTLEAMIVSPTPRPILLLAKYVAVVTVALLTAVANLSAMSVTLWASGLGRLVFGTGGLSLMTIAQILCLLVLFAMFFSAVLLSITSFAKSFKEAQAYLIPVMLISLAPGVLSLLPQVRLTSTLAVVPLANIVLLSRDVLVGAATAEAALISVACTIIYALAAIAVASRLFGSDASMQGSQGSWRDFLRRPDESAATPTVDQMALTMACLFPLYFVASTSLPLLPGSLAYRLLMSSVVSWLLIFGLPTLVSYYRRLDFRSTYLLAAGPVRNWLVWLPSVVLLASSLWMVGHELMMISRQLGLATFSQEQLKQAEAFASKLPEIPLALILFTGAITPAICEEWFFRGFVLASLRRFGATTAIVGSALLFGMMHVLTSNMLSLERFLPSVFMGLVLGLVAWRCGALWPGIALHALHNGLLLSIGHFRAQLEAWGIGLEENAHLPLTWLAGGLVAIVVGLALLLSPAASPRGRARGTGSNLTTDSP